MDIETNPLSVQVLPFLFQNQHVSVTSSSTAKKCLPCQNVLIKRGITLFNGKMPFTYISHILNIKPNPKFKEIGEEFRAYR